MNRLIIIGNGFDLAHGLPTSYRDFMDDLWIQIVENSEKHKELVYLDNRNYDITPIKKDCNYKKLLENIESYCKHSKKNYSQLTWDAESLHFYAVHIDSIEIKEIFYFNNDFFKTISSEHHENWVDIENSYYKELKKIARYRGNDISKSEDFWVKERKKNVKKLNNEFDLIKILFVKYLTKTSYENYNFDIDSKKEIEDHLKESLKFNDFLFEKKTIEYFQSDKNFDLNNTLLLSFNYTQTVEDYRNHISKDFKLNYIHGKINEIYPEEEFPIIFGFGDEMDENYKMIEDIDDNEYLKNFKSIQYLEHSNYKSLFNFIEAEPYQVFIMGHSCGLSDRTLLSTIFENTNCLSIKVFYHQKTKNTDNYTELIQNISRHFKDKKLLRKKVVEKKHCKPLIEFRENIDESTN